MTVFSFHPVKHITTGEGGMVTTDDPELAKVMRIFRNHGITSDHRERERCGSWFYEMVELGYNYRLPDINCALGLSQLKRLDQNVSRRRNWPPFITKLFRIEAVKPLTQKADRNSAWHLYVVKLDLNKISIDRKIDRKDVFSSLRDEGIGVNVHYIPVYWHPYYQKLGYKRAYAR